MSSTFHVRSMLKKFSFFYSSKSGNPTPSLDPILSTYFPSLTPFEGGDFILEEIEACFTNDSIPPEIDDADFDPEGDLLLLEKLLNDDPSSTLPLKKLHFEEIKIIKSSIDDPSKLELKDLPSHLEYAFLEGTNKLPVIISKELKDEEKAALLKFLKSHKRAINGIFPNLRDAQHITRDLQKKRLLAWCLLSRNSGLLSLIKDIVYTDHSALKYLLAKQDAKSRLLWWILLLQEFDVIIRDKKGAKNLAADHLLRLVNPTDVLETRNYQTHFSSRDPLERYLFVVMSCTPWFADIPNYHAGNFIVKGMSSQPEKSNEKLKVSLNIIEKRFNYNPILILSTNEKR
ncbi:hypothetical protein Tco_0718212 [Tanacetum coccineum]